MGKIICLSGKPGAGKGTRLSKFLEGRENEYVSLSCGNILRKEMQEETELGKRIKAHMDAGQLAPDDLIMEMVQNHIKKTPEDVNIIFDGFPRTVNQVECCQKCGIKINRFINMVASDEEVLRRAKVRIVCTNCGATYTTDNFHPPKKEGICDKCGGELKRRGDDTEEVVRKRLEIFRKETEPVCDEIIKLGIDLCQVEGEGPDEEFIQNDFNRAILTTR